METSYSAETKVASAENEQAVESKVKKPKRIDLNGSKENSCSSAPESYGNDKGLNQELQEDENNNNMIVTELALIPNSKLHIRHCLLYEYQQGSSAPEARKRICATYGDDVISESTCFYWYKKFRSGVYDLCDSLRAGRPSELVDAELREMVLNNPGMTTRKLGDQFGLDHSTILKHLNRMGLVFRKSCWTEKVAASSRVSSRKARRRKGKISTDSSSKPNDKQTECLNNSHRILETQTTSSISTLMPIFTSVRSHENLGHASFNAPSHPQSLTLFQAFPSQELGESLHVPNENIQSSPPIVQEGQLLILSTESGSDANSNSIFHHSDILLS